MKPERLQEIYAAVSSVVIPLPQTDSISYHDVVAVFQQCDDYGNKLNKYLIEVTLDIDRVERQLALKQSYYDTRIEELIMAGGPDFQGCATDTAKLRRAKYLLRKEGTEIAELTSEVSASKSLQKIIRKHASDAEEKNNTAKKYWEMHNTNQKLFEASARAAEPLVFTDPFVEHMVQGTAKGTSEATDNQLGAEVDFQANKTKEAAPGELYKEVEPPKTGDDSEKSKVDGESASIIEKEGGDMSDILDSL